MGSEPLPPCQPMQAWVVPEALPPPDLPKLSVEEAEYIEQVITVGVRVRARLSVGIRVGIRDRVRS